MKTFVWFTYRYDAPILLRSVRSVQAIYPDANIVICDDISGGLTLPTRAMRTLQALGAILIPTNWVRRGNLRGWNCAKEIATTLHWAQDVTGSKIVVKMDSDSILLNPKWLDVFENSSDDYIASGMRSRCKRAFCGASYALKKEGLNALKGIFDNEMESPYLTEEDFEMSSRIYRYSGGTNKRMLLVPYSLAGIHPQYADAVAGAYSWEQDTPLWRRFIADRWQMVVFNNTAMPPAATPKEQGHQLWKNAVRKSRAARQILQALTTSARTDIL